MMFYHITEIRNSCLRYSMNRVSIPAVIMAAVSTYVGFYYLWMYARRRAEAENLAFAVGFESLPTFNRAFLKVMRTTPTQYRVQNR
jgi:AraC-like DNA-binding protein